MKIKHGNICRRRSSASCKHRQPFRPFCKTYFLTKRETEIVGLLMDGLTPALIGQRLNVSVATVYRHIANIYQKCHISNRQELQRLFSGLKPRS